MSRRGRHGGDALGAPPLDRSQGPAAADLPRVEVAAVHGNEIADLDVDLIGRDLTLLSLGDHSFGMFLRSLLIWELIWSF